MNICDLKDIHKFFKPFISKNRGFILNEYAEYIDAEYKRYSSGVIAAKGGRTGRQWERIFDEAITRNESKYPDLLFKLAFTGSYWEIYVTKKLTGNGVQTCTDPILNVRSTIFGGNPPKIYFFRLRRTNNQPGTEDARKICDIQHSDSYSDILSW